MGFYGEKEGAVMKNPVLGTAADVLDNGSGKVKRTLGKAAKLPAVPEKVREKLKTVRVWKVDWITFTAAALIFAVGAGERIEAVKNRKKK